MNSYSNKKTIMSVSIVFFMTMLTSLLSFVGELLFAQYFGVSEVTDAYSIAYQLPSTLFAVVASAVATTTIPQYTKALKEGKDSADAFSSAFLTLIALIAVGFVVICEIFAPFVIKIFSPGLNATTNEYAVQYVRLFFPTVIFTSFMSVMMGILQTHGDFAKSGSLTVIRQFIYMVVLFVGNRFWGIYAAIFGVLIATVFEWIASVVYASKHITLRPSFNFKNDKVIEAARMTMPIIISLGAAEISAMVNKIVASFLESGSISMLSYASKLSSVFNALIINSISTVMFPFFANLSAKNDKRGLTNTYFLTLDSYLYLTVPIIAGGVILRQELVEIVFMRGAFTQENADAVSILFAGYLLTMIFTAIRQTTGKLFHASGNTKTPATNTVIGIIVHILLNIILGLKWGAIGLVAATVVSTIVTTTLLLFSSRNLIINDRWKDFFISLAKSLFASTAMILVILMIKPIISEWTTILSTIALIFIGVAVYLAMLLILRVKELKEVIRLVKKK